MKKLSVFVLIFILLFTLFGCKPLPMTVPSTSVTAAPTAAPTTKPTEDQSKTTSVPPADVTVSLRAVGDCLLHTSVTRSCETENGYDFTRLFTHIEDSVRNADLAFINQEVMLCGWAENYPTFAAPFEVADALKSAGFDIVNIATNHSLDQGADGFLKCVDALKDRGLTFLGGGSTEEESEKDVIVEVKGIKIGFLSYTYDCNGYTAPKDMPWLVHLIDPYTLGDDVKALREKCDFLIVSMHWGVEYSDSPSDYQRQLAQIICDNGGDLIIGTHPHVIQPVETLEGKNGHTCLCVYSLGNYVSGQSRLYTMLGGMACIDVTFSGDGVFKDITCGVVPLVTHYEPVRTGHEVFYLADYTKELSDRHGMHLENDAGVHMDHEKLKAHAEEILGDCLIWRD